MTTEIADLNPGIARTVALLNDHGFRTCDSGDGVTRLYGCDRGYPYVVVRTTASKLVREARRLLRVISDQGLAVQPIGIDNLPSIQADFDPVEGSAFITLSNVTDAILFDGSTDKPWLDLPEVSQ